MKFSEAGLLLLGQSCILAVGVGIVTHYKSIAEPAPLTCVGIVSVVSKDSNGVIFSGYMPCRQLCFRPDGSMVASRLKNKECQ